MKYDKNSFLAGISVGRTLKGWAAGSDGFSGGGSGEGGGMDVILVSDFKYPVFSPSIIVDSLDVILVSSYVEG